jgi:hypothetical protein
LRRADGRWAKSVASCSLSGIPSVVLAKQVVRLMLTGVGVKKVASI